MKTLKASMRYDKDANYRLAQVISRIRRPWSRPTLYFICILSIASGFFYFTDIIIQLAVIAFGCLLFTSIPVPARHRAERSLQAVGGKPFIVTYYFENDRFLMNSTIGQKNELAYHKIIYLIEDKKYLYILSDLSSAYMLEKESMERSACKELKTFLSLKTNKTWKKFF